MSLYDHLPVGARVRVLLNEDKPWTADWQDQAQELFVAGVSYDIGAKAITYDIADVWPPTNLGQITGDFDADDITAL